MAGNIKYVDRKTPPRPRNSGVTPKVSKHSFNKAYQPQPTARSTPASGSLIKGSTPAMPAKTVTPLPQLTNKRGTAVGSMPPGKKTVTPLPQLTGTRGTWGGVDRATNKMPKMGAVAGASAPMKNAAMPRPAGMMGQPAGPKPKPGVITYKTAK